MRPPSRCVNLCSALCAGFSSGGSSGFRDVIDGTGAGQVVDCPGNSSANDVPAGDNLSAPSGLVSFVFLSGGLLASGSEGVMPSLQGDGGAACSPVDRSSQLFGNRSLIALTMCRVQAERLVQDYVQPVGSFGMKPRSRAPTTAWARQLYDGNGFIGLVHTALGQFGANMPRDQA